MSDYRKTLPDKDFLNNRFFYTNGDLFYKNAVANQKKGNKAGNLGSNGYMRIVINNKHYSLHRIIWAMHYEIVPDYIDHIDGNPLNNKIENLRVATQSQNRINSRKRFDSKSGHKNVSFHKLTNKWAVQISVKNIRKSLGVYKHKEIAAIIAELARHKYHGNFARHD